MICDKQFITVVADVVIAQPASLGGNVMANTEMHIAAPLTIKGSFTGNDVSFVPKDPAQPQLNVEGCMSIKGKVSVDTTNLNLSNQPTKVALAHYECKDSIAAEEVQLQGAQNGSYTCADPPVYTQTDAYVMLRSSDQPCGSSLTSDDKAKSSAADFPLWAILLVCGIILLMMVLTVVAIRKYTMDKAAREGSDPNYITMGSMTNPQRV